MKKTTGEKIENINSEIHKLFSSLIEFIVQVHDSIVDTINNVINSKSNKKGLEARLNFLMLIYDILYDDVEKIEKFIRENCYIFNLVVKNKKEFYAFLMVIMENCKKEELKVVELENYL
jgi:hypothetical protein